MKRQILFASLIMAFSFVTSSAIACPTPYLGPYSIGSLTYADYTQDQSCYTGSSSRTSIYCFSEPSWSFGSGTTTVSTSFTIGPNDWVGDPSKWNAGSWIDFSSPGGTSQDRFEIDVDVLHPNNTISRYTVLYWAGTMGSLSSCGGNHFAYFTANHGDTIIVTIAATNSGTANIVVSRPRIFSDSN